jgi:hypothetical protein
MTLETKHGAGRKGRAPLRSALSVVFAAAFAVTVIAPSQFALAGVGGAGVLDQASTADQLLIQVGQGQGGGKGKGKGKGGQARGPGGGGGGGGNNKMVVRGPHGNKAVVAKGQKNTVVKRTYVNKTYVNKRVVVVRPVRGWNHRSYYGNFVSGVALGTIIGVTAVGLAPIAPASNLCWYWSDPAMINGYWDYCY